MIRFVSGDLSTIAPATGANDKQWAQDLGSSISHRSSDANVAVASGLDASLRILVQQQQPAAAEVVSGGDHCTDIGSVVRTGCLASSPARLLQGRRLLCGWGDW